MTFDLVVVTFVGDDHMALALEQDPLGLEYGVLAARFLISIVNEKKPDETLSQRSRVFQGRQTPIVSQRDRAGPLGRRQTTDRRGDPAVRSVEQSSVRESIFQAIAVTI